MDREKVIKGLEKLIDTAVCVAIHDADCKSCPYISVNGCIDQIHKDALELLKENEKQIADYRRWHENQKNTIGELLKAQEPVEPKMLEFIDEGLTWEKYEIPSCGKCGALLGDALYCPNCGRAVKWDG